MHNMKKAEFVFFARRAIKDRKSDEYIILYNYFLKSFCHADEDHDGVISANEFGKMVDEASVLPREYGFETAAQTEERKKQFKAIDTNGDGSISFDEWLAHSIEDFSKKVAAVKPHPMEESPKAEFTAFIKKAADKKSQEFAELYYFLVHVFTQSDADYDGQISVDEFDTMIDRSSKMLQEHGFTQKTSSMSDADRKATRKAQFDAIDVNKDGSVSLDEWINYAHKDITSKV